MIRKTIFAVSPDEARAILTGILLAFEGDTLNQVWPEQKKLEPLWFWNYDQPKNGAPLSYGKTTTP